jgi:uncharacterized membrane protein
MDSAAVTGVVLSETGVQRGNTASTGDGTGIPQIALVGIAVLVFLILYFLVRSSRTSGRGGESSDYSTSAQSNYASDGPQRVSRGPQYSQTERNGWMHTAGPSSHRGISALTHVLGFFLWTIERGFVYFISTDPFVKQNTANVIHWQGVLLVCGLLSVLLIPVVNLLMLVVLGALSILFTPIAVVKAVNGDAWQYPLALEVL